MMRLSSLVRDVVLVGFAVGVGWWARGADSPVLAQRSSSSSSARGPGSDDSLAFQMIGTGPESTLAMYNPGNRTLYVYARAGAGASTVNCTYSYTINTPGAALERKNCPVGELQ